MLVELSVNLIHVQSVNTSESKRNKETSQISPSVVAQGVDWRFRFQTETQCEELKYVGFSEPGCPSGSRNGILMTCSIRAQLRQAEGFETCYKLIPLS